MEVKNMALLEKNPKDLENLLDNGALTGLLSRVFQGQRSENVVSFRLGQSCPTVQEILHHVRKHFESVLCYEVIPDGRSSNPSLCKMKIYCPGNRERYASISILVGCRYASHRRNLRIVHTMITIQSS